MRTLHFQIKRRTKEGKFAPAGVHVQYITRGAAGVEYLQRTGPYAHREDLLATGHGNLPAWADENPVTFFAEGDKWERNAGVPMGELGKTRHGRVCTQIDASLPRELSLDDHKQVVQDFLTAQLGERHAYVWAIHQPTASDGQPYPHFHAAFSERRDTGKALPPHEYFSRMGNQKDRMFNAAGWPRAARQAWSDTLNVCLERNQSLSRIDPRTLRAQGIDRTPARKLDTSELRRDDSPIREQARYAENYAATHAYWETRKRELGITRGMGREDIIQRIGDASREAVRPPQESQKWRRTMDLQEAKDTLSTVKTLRQAEEHYVRTPSEIRSVAHLANIAKVVRNDDPDHGQVRRRRRERDDEPERGRTYAQSY